MSDTRVLLTKIAALRQRLEKMPEAAGVTPASRSNALPVAARQVESRLATASHYGTLLDGSFRQLADAPTALGEPVRLPARLTARAHRLLQVGQGLLGQLRILSQFFEPALDRDDPLAERYRQTVAMADTALRCVQAYPESAAAQLRLCEGLEATLGVLAERIAVLHTTVARRRRERDRIAALADLLHGMETGKAPELKHFVGIAESLLAEARETAPLRLLLAEWPQDPAPAELIARHCLTVGQVAARLVERDADLRNQAIEAVLAALVHDVGMLRVPADIMALAGPLDDAQRRVVETHPRISGELVSKHLPEAAWLAEVAACHHERADGTGYPVGLRDAQIPLLARLLAVCDVYVALCSCRPQRLPLDPRTALTDTLLLADKGGLDRACAERLLTLSFYPAGSVVELADGAVGLVVATHPSRSDLSLPARPVVALLTNNKGQPLASPRPLDLAGCESRSIVRALRPAERRQLLGQRYADLA
jgi:HD-GYP domain-containing protein (c-di-GMP phosphodiesterase class II)